MAEKKTLYLKRVENGVEVPFPSAENPAYISTYSYEAVRMGSAPVITAELMYSSCLDDLWTYKEYVEYEGEKYYVLNIPTSSKSNEDIRYKHTITFTSRRVVLENELFYDVVTVNTELQYKDRYRSNTTKFSFSGDIAEFASRLTDSMEYSGLYNAETGDGYKVVIDNDITSEVKTVSFSDKYLSEALQEISNTYELAYYFVGTVCHVGYSDKDVISEAIEYGPNNPALSIEKTNANVKIVDRITGMGGSTNLPYYYPNDAEGGTIPYSSKLMPSVYRESAGLERYLPAKNDTYIIPDSDPEQKYVFEHEYQEGNPHSALQTDDTIIPTIRYIKNANNQLIGEIEDIAFDKEDSDALRKDSTEYLHSYFYIKLRIFNGPYGFNLFEHAIESETAKIEMISGNCSTCAFEIGVDKQQVESEYVFHNPVYTDGTSNNKLVAVEITEPDEKGTGYLGDYILKPSFGKDYVASQQNTQTYSVWVAVKKETSTFGIIMPNVTHNYKPQKGDKFVITGIKLPDSYITEAEKRLDEALVKYMSENNSEKFTFSIKLSRIFLAEHEDFAQRLDENSRIIIRYNGHDYTQYVTNYTCKADENILYEVTLTLAEKLTITQSPIRQQLDAMKADILGARGNSVDILGTGAKYFLRKDQNDTTTHHLTVGGLLVDGAVVEEGEIVEDSSVDGISDALTEDNGGSVDPSSGGTDVTDATWGQMKNVDEAVDSIAEGVYALEKQANGKFGAKSLESTIAITRLNQRVNEVEDSVPSKTSELTNDSGFLTEHQDISGKAEKSEVETLRAKVNDNTAEITTAKTNITDLRTYADDTFTKKKLATRTYTDVIASANTIARGEFWFLKVRPTSYTQKFSIKYTMHIDVANAPQGSGDFICEISSNIGGSVVYRYWNGINVSWRPIYCHSYTRPLNETQYNNGIDCLVGLSLYSSTNPTTATNKRTITVDMIEAVGCTWELLDELATYSSLWNSTNYADVARCNAYSAGLQEIGDNDSWALQRVSDSSYSDAGSQVYNYHLLFSDNGVKWYDICPTVYSASSKAKVVSTQGFNPKYMCCLCGNSFSKGANIVGLYTYLQLSTDVRYITNTLSWTAKKPIYLICTYNNEDGLMYCKSSDWLTQDLPTTDDGYYYIRLGYMYSATNIQYILYSPPIYKYCDGAAREVNPYLAEKIPTNVSELQNDSGFLTSHQDISSKADKSEIYNKQEVDILLSQKGDSYTVATDNEIQSIFNEIF